LLNTLKCQKIHVEKESKKVLAAQATEALKNAGMVLVYFSAGMNGKDTYTLRRSLHRNNIRFFTGKSNADMFLSLHNHPMLVNLLAGGGSVLLTSPHVQITEANSVVRRFNNIHFMGGIVKNKNYPKQFILLDPAKLREALTLPSHKDLVAQAIGQIMQGPQMLTSILSTPFLSLISLLQYYQEQKKGEATKEKP